MSRTILFASATESDRLVLERARALLPAAMPPAIDRAAKELTEAAAVERLDARAYVLRAFGSRDEVAAAHRALFAHAARSGACVLVLPCDVVQRDVLALSTVPHALADAALVYVASGGAENYASLLRMLSDHAFGTAFGHGAPVALPESGYYHPRAADRLACASLDFEAFRAAFWKPARPAIGILFYRA